MQIDSWIIYSTMVAFAVALLLCGVLMMACLKTSTLLTKARNNSREQSKRVKALQEQLETQHAQQQAAVPAIPEAGILDLGEQQTETDSRHQQLQGGEQCNEHLQPDAKLPLRVTALRHHYLAAEQEALAAAENCWRVLDVKLGMLLKQLHHAETAATPDLTSPTPEPALNAELMGELQRLRDVTSSQQEQIQALESRLNSANSHEEKDALLADMQKQLNQQSRYMLEADTCIQQVEEELNSTSQQLQSLSTEHQQIKNYGGEMEILIRDFSEQSRDMLQCIAILERENRDLRSEDDAGDTNDVSNTTETDARAA